MAELPSPKEVAKRPVSSDEDDYCNSNIIKLMSLPEGSSYLQSNVDLLNSNRRKHKQLKTEAIEVVPDPAEDGFRKDNMVITEAQVSGNIINAGSSLDLGEANFPTPVAPPASTLQLPPDLAPPSFVSGPQPTFQIHSPSEAAIWSTTQDGDATSPSSVQKIIARNNRYRLEPLLFKCDVCTKLFQHQSSLERHRLSHTRDLPHRCHICSKPFRDFAQLMVHLMTHSEERPYACKQCHKKFKLYYEFKVHKKRHAKETAYACKPCKTAYVRRWHLTRHWKKTGCRPTQIRENLDLAAEEPTPGTSKDTNIEAGRLEMEGLGFESNRDSLNSPRCDLGQESSSSESN